MSTILPSSETVYPDTDWIIGNHSDELTPWIPVMAARSSPKCNFFLLPCCCYEFNGKKYQRRNSSLSQYSDYLHYIEDIINICDFECEIDKLRIPSTKRICLIGRKRKINNFEEIDKKIMEYINSQSNNKNNDWIDNYKPREDKEIVRNCTKLDKNLTNTIVKKVFDHLIVSKNFVNSAEDKLWNRGRSVSLPDLVQIITKDELKQLKKECGGLQTLLKNHHFIFEVVSGSVQLRLPIVKRTDRLKTRDCWFFKNHPDGCYLNDENCSYLHKK